MKGIRVYNVPRRGKERWFVAQGKDILSGPWPTNKVASQAKLEWIIVK